MTHATPDDALIAACTLAAAHEAARRMRAGEQLTDIPRYVRTRTERMVRDHAALWATLPSPDPIDFARALEPGLAGTTTNAPATVRTLPDGTQQRFLPGTGWATIHQPARATPPPHLANDPAYLELIAITRDANRTIADAPDESTP